MARKHHAIDILKLYSEKGTKEWNEFLFMCRSAKNVSELKKTYYGLQVGMDDLAKKKLNSNKITSFFIRLQRSIENEVKKIYREVNMSPLDDPNYANRLKLFDRKKYDALYEKKKKRDSLCEKYLREGSF